MKSPLTTLCYVEQDGCYLMLHRVSKKNDVNKDKWIGIGGHFEEGESPEECLLREAYEETGLRLTSWRFRGMITFLAEGWPTEYMCLYTADGFEGDIGACNEGVLEWVPKSEVTKLNLWEGDKVFLKLLAEEAPFFSMKMEYRGDVLIYAALDGKKLELFDVCDENGTPTGVVTERSVAHLSGIMHRTAHVWLVRESNGQWELLLQKRSARKTSFPGCLDVSAAGHVMAGDEVLDSALRELEEELGIKAVEEELAFVGSFDSGDIFAEFQGQPFHDREFAGVYVYRKEPDEKMLCLQEDEVEDVVWMRYEDVLAAARNRDPGFCVHESELKMLGNYLGISGSAACARTAGISDRKIYAGLKGCEAGSE